MNELALAVLLSTPIAQPQVPHVPTQVESKKLAASPSFKALKSWLPSGVELMGGVVPWSEEFGPGGGGSAYASIQPFTSKGLKPLTLKPGFGVWYQKTEYVSKDSFAYVDDENDFAIFDDMRDDKTVSRRVFDWGKVVYAPTLGRFTPYVGVGLATGMRRDVWKTTDRIRFVSGGETQFDETFVTDEGKTETSKTAAYFNAGVKVAVNKSWSALADYATSPILGPRLSLGVGYALGR